MLPSFAKAMAVIAAIALAPPLAAEAGGAAALLPLGHEILSLGPAGPSNAGAWVGEAGPRDSCSYPGGFVAFDRATKTLFRASISAAGQVDAQPLGTIDAAEVFLTRDRAIARASVFERAKGFAFTLYELGPSSLKAVRTFSLDCFPSDCVYAAGRWYLAGADAADSHNRLYSIDPGTGERKTVAELPKARDFGRVVTDGRTLWFYLSPAVPRAGSQTVLRVRLLGADGKAIAGRPEPVTLAGLGEGRCLYGSGFAYRGRFWLPCASGEGKAVNEVMEGFDPEGASPLAPQIRAALDTGIYAPVGESSGLFYAFGFLYLKDPAAMSLLAIGPDGLVAKKTAIPAR
jgi:hypothetical protein